MAGSPLSPNAVHKLRKVLQKMVEPENDGNIVIEGLWHEEDIESELVLEKTLSAPDHDRNTSICIGNSRLKRLEEVLDAIDFLKSSLERRIANFRQRKLHRTLMDLPDELLVLTFEMAKPNLSDLTSWSLVCRKLKSIIISTPSLWSQQRLLMTMPQHIFDTIVSRSGTRTLRLHVESPFLPNDEISKYCDRWDEIILDELTETDLRLFQRVTPSSALTSLRSLRLIETPMFPFNYDFDVDWCPVALEYLHCTCSIPLGLTASTLTNCSFEFHSNIDLLSLAVFLSSTPLLSCLSISVSEIGVHDLPVVKDTLIELPSLNNFTFRSFGLTKGAVTGILEATSFPNVTSLTIDIEEGEENDVVHVIDSFGSTVGAIKRKYKHLERLDLKVVCMEFDNTAYYDSFCVDELLMILPESIKSFSVTAFRVKLRVNCYVPIGTLKDLRSVRFDDCNCLDFEFFEDLATRFEDDKIRLDVLDIQHCQEVDSDGYIQEEAVKKLFRHAGVLQTYASSALN